jgi:hypothetical protein
LTLELSGGGQISVGFLDGFELGSASDPWRSRDTMLLTPNGNICGAKIGARRLKRTPYYVTQGSPYYADAPQEMCHPHLITGQAS